MKNTYAIVKKKQPQSHSETMINEPSIYFLQLLLIFIHVLLLLTETGKLKAHNPFIVSEWP